MKKLITFKGHVGKKLAVLGALVYCSAANAANFAATDTLVQKLSDLQGDITTDITPKAIGAVVAVAFLVAGRSLIKKFFKI